MGKSDTVYVRVDPELKAWLSNAAENSGLSEKVIIENVLRYLTKLPTHELQAILYGARGSLASAARAIELYIWGQNSYSKNRFDWALQNFIELERYAAETDAVHLQQVAHFRMGQCWLGIADGLRLDALHPVAKAGAVTTAAASRRRRLTPDSVPNWNELYQAADRAITAAIYHCERFRRLSDDVSKIQPDLIYNSACCYSMKAQFIVERAWSPASDEIMKLAQIIQAKTPKAKTRKGQKDVTDLGHGSVRDETPPGLDAFWQGQRVPDGLGNSVNDLCDKALRDLEDLLGFRREGGGPVYLPNPGSITRYARTDVDLVFIRNVKYTQERFENLVSKYPILTKLDSFRDLWVNLPYTIRAEIESTADSDPKETG